MSQTSRRQQAEEDWFAQEAAHLAHDPALLCQAYLERYIEQRDRDLHPLIAQGTLVHCHVAQRYIAEQTVNDPAIPGPIRTEALAILLSSLSLYGLDYADEQVVIDLLRRPIEGDMHIAWTLCLVSQLPLFDRLWQSSKEAVFERLQEIQRVLNPSIDEVVRYTDDVRSIVRQLRGQLRTRPTTP